MPQTHTVDQQQQCQCNVLGFRTYLKSWYTIAVLRSLHTFSHGCHKPKQMNNNAMSLDFTRLLGANALPLHCIEVVFKWPWSIKWHCIALHFIKLHHSAAHCKDRCLSVITQSNFFQGNICTTPPPPWWCLGGCKPHWMITKNVINAENAIIVHQ